MPESGARGPGSGAHGGSGGAPRYRFLLTLWFRKWAGDPRAVHELATGLMARGHGVLVACPSDGILGRRLRASGVPIHDMEFERGWSLNSARELAALVRKEKIDLVDSHAARDRKAVLLARHLFGMRARVVVTRRAMSGTFPLANWIYAAGADQVVAISRAVAESLVRRGTPRAKVAVVHTGVDPDRMGGTIDPEEVDALRREYALDPALPTVGVVGRRKDQETLLRAATLLGRPLNVLFVGIERDGRLASLEEELPRGSRVAYTGFRERVLPFYHLLDVKVLTTRAEGLSQAILESMVAGVPVVSAAVGGTPEIVVDGESGLLFPPGDAGALAAILPRLLDDRALRERLVRGGRERIEGYFHRDRLVDRTEALYLELLQASA